MSEDNRRSLYETACKECCFAVYHGKTQVGCRFDRIEKFRRHGIEVIEAKDEEREFFVVEGACRLHKNVKSPWYLRTPPAERMERAREEIQLHVEVVVVMQEGDTVEQARGTIRSLTEQSIRPSVTVVVNRGGVKPTDLLIFMPDDWSVRFITERREGKRVSKERCVDIALADSKADFYATFSPGAVVPRDFILAIDRAINDDLERFLLLEPNDEGQGMVVRMTAHTYFGGNAEAVIEGEGDDEAAQRADTIVEKIQHRAHVEGNEHLIKKVVDVCPTMASDSCGPYRFVRWDREQTRHLGARLGGEA